MTTYLLTDTGDRLITSDNNAIILDLAAIVSSSISSISTPIVLFKKKLHQLISGQLPEYIVSQYPIFVDFLTAYYTFLDQDGQVNDLLLNSGTWQDIDLTLDLFIPEYRTQFSYDIPETALVQSRRLVKYIYDYYEAKGSENAVHLFFRFMYNETATVVYPGNYILRSSDGQWSQKRIIKIDATGYQDRNIYALAGKKIQLTYLEEFGGGGTKRHTITVSCFNVVQELEPNIYQLEVDIDPAYQFPAVIAADPLIGSLGTYDTYVYVMYENVICGVLTKQLTGVISIDVPGENFRIDDAYEIGETGIEGKYFSGTGFSAYCVIPLNPQDSYVLETYSNHAIIRVKQVSKVLETGVQGQIRQFQIVDTGERFTCRQSNSITSQPYVALDYCYQDGYPSTNSTLYAVDIETVVPVNSFTLQLLPEHGTGAPDQVATITFRTGLVFVADGSYKDASGFLSDVTKLQDHKYYQPFSYVIRSQQPFHTWRQLYENSNHPAGFRVFAELQFLDTLSETVQIIDGGVVVSSVANDVLLLEDGSYFLLETGNYLDLEAGFYDIVVLETGGDLLLESGDVFSLEL